MSSDVRSGTVGGMDADVEPTGMYLRRVTERTSELIHTTRTFINLPYLPHTPILAATLKTIGNLLCPQLFHVCSEFF